MRPVLATILLLTLAATAARAEGPPATTDEDRRRGADLVAAWRAARPALLGQQHLGVHGAGPAHLATVSLRIEASDEPGAAYRVTVDWTHGARGLFRWVLLLDAHLSVLRRWSDGADEQGMPFPAERWTRTPGTGWLYEGAGRFTGPDQPQYAEAWAATLVARAAPAAPATYELPGFAWPRGGGPEPWPRAPVVVRVEPERPLQHRGREVAARRVAVWLGDVGPWVHALDREGRLLQLELPDGTRAVAGTAEEAGAALDARPAVAPTPDEAAALLLARACLRVTLLGAPPTELDEHADWRAIQAATDDPALARLAPDDFLVEARSALLRAERPPGDLRRTAFEQALRELRAVVRDGEATVTRGERDLVLRARRSDGGWRITALPLPPRR